MSDYCYSFVSALATITVLIINYSFFLGQGIRQEVKDYKRYLVVILAYFITDILWGVFKYAGNTHLLYIDTVLYYIFMAFSVVLCCRYIISFLGLGKLFAKFLNGFGFAFAAGEICLLVANHFSPLFFSYDAVGNYQTYPLRNLVFSTQIFMFAFISITSFIVYLQSKGVERGRTLSISLFGLTMTLALVAQRLFPLLPLYAVGLMIGTLIIHVFITNEDNYIHIKQIEKLNDNLEDEKAELQKQMNEMANALGVINGLSHDYHTIWSADKEDMKIQLIRMPGVGAIKESVKLATDYADCDVAMQKYIERYVCDEDKERLRRQVNIKVVLEQLSKSDFYAVNYMRQKENGEVDYNQVAFANADTSDGRKRLVFGFRNIDDVLKQEQALRKEISDAKIAAETANAAKTTFLFSMSHDIRTPMNAIIGFRDLLEKNQDDPEKRANYLKKIKESSNILLSIINNVLEMARIEKGVLELNEKPVTVESFVETLSSVILDMMNHKGLTYTQQIDIQHSYIYCDANKLREIFINILSNAYKYTMPGGKIHLHLEELPSDRHGYVRYRTTISDTGIGMSEDFLPHIFEEFTRESNSTHSKIEGTGLGMPIVKRLIDFMDGTIEVHSKKGVGSTFIVTFDHRIASQSDIIDDTEDASVQTFTGKRLLLAEDNELNAEIAITLLKEADFEIERAADGQECLDMLLQAPVGYYDLILMDIQMPRLNGYETTEAIRALKDDLRSQIPIIAMTANAFEEDKLKAISVGMNGHLGKPINVPELIKTVSQTLAHSS